MNAYIGRHASLCVNKEMFIEHPNPCAFTCMYIYRVYACTYGHVPSSKSPPLFALHGSLCLLVGCSVCLSVSLYCTWSAGAPARPAARPTVCLSVWLDSVCDDDDHRSDDALDGKTRISEMNQALESVLVNGVNNGVHTYIHTYIHTYMHACIRAYIYTYIYIYIHIHMYIWCSVARPPPPPPSPPHGYPPLRALLCCLPPPPPCGAGGLGGAVVYVGCLTPAHPPVVWWWVLGLTPPPLSPPVMWCGAVFGCGFQV